MLQQSPQKNDAGRQTFADSDGGGMGMPPYDLCNGIVDIHACWDSSVTHSARWNLKILT
jgi:hypothetical protein